MQELAAKKLGGKPENYEVANARVFRKGGGAGMTFAQAANYAIQLGGIYDGHELPKEIKKYTGAVKGTRNVAEFQKTIEELPKDVDPALPKELKTASAKKAKPNTKKKLKKKKRTKKKYANAKSSSNANA